MIASANAFLPNSTGGISPSHSKHIDNDAGILSDETRTALNQTVYQVANTVVSAGGWMTSTLTCKSLVSPLLTISLLSAGLGTLNRLIVGDTQPTETSFASSSTAKGAMKHEVDLLDDDDNDNDLPENRSPRLQLSDREDDRPVEYGEHEEDDEEEQEDSGDEYRMIGGSSSTHNLI